MAASSLAIITSSIPPGPKLHRAIGTWAAMNGLGGAAGVLFGGIITQELSWRWILLINPPIAIAAAVVAYAVVANRRRAEDGASFDVAGALMLTVGQMVLVYGVVEAGLYGWGTARALGPIGVGAAMLVAFVVIETRFASAPLVPFKELTKSLQIANNVVLLFSAALFPMWFVSSLYLQQVLGLSPLHTGLTFLPMTLMIMLVASRAGRLVSRFGVRTVLCGGLTMLTAGMLLMARIASSGSGIVYIMVPGLLTAAGIAMSIVPSTIAATHGAKKGQEGLASGLVNTSRQVGGGLGLAFLITLATQRSSHLIGIGTQVPQALTEGFRLAYLIGGGLAGAAAIMAFVSVPRADAEVRVAARRLAAAIGVLVVAFVSLDLAFANSRGAPIGAYLTDGAYSFVTEPALRPPQLTTDEPTATGQLAPGYILTANFYDLNYPPMTGQSGPLILDDNLQPVWFKPVPENVVAVEPEPADLRGQAGARLVAGLRDEHRRDRERRGHRRQPALPDGRDAAGQGRLEAHAARARDPRRRRLGHREQGHPGEPLPLRRRLQRRADRLGRAGVQPQDRQAALQLGRARSTSRPATPTRRCRRTASRGTPTTSTRSSCSATEPSSSRCATRGPSTWSTSKTGGIEWTLGGKHSSFSSGRRRGVPVAARRRPAAPAPRSRCSTTTAAS